VKRSESPPLKQQSLAEKNLKRESKRRKGGYTSYFGYFILTACG
jgi:hypothetical protein